MAWRRLAAIAVGSLSLIPATSAQALCIHAGKLYARTTLAQEYRESRWVIRARLISADDHPSVTRDAWTIYRLKVLAAFKGRPAPRMSVFTERNSGGFYLDKGAAHDIGGEYLLFLRPASRDDAPANLGSIPVVNYACGQSKPWADVSSRELIALRSLVHPASRS